MFSCAYASRVVIVMMDTRSPQWSNWSSNRCKVSIQLVEDIDVLSLTYFMNLEYATRHGYDLIFYQSYYGGCARFRCAASCRHERWGERHPSYCKLSGLAAAFEAGYEWVVYLDSDAFVANTTLSLPELLRAYGADAGAASGEESATHHGFFGWDWPYSLGPNMGFIVLRNTGEMRRMVATCASAM